MVVTLVAQLTVAYENLLFLDEIRRGEESLRRSERKYKNFVTNASYGICHADPEGRPLSANPALLRMLEYESEEAFLGSSTLPFEKLLLENAFTSFRYGGKFGNRGAYRLFGKYSNYDSFKTLKGDDNGDGWDMKRGAI